MKDTHSIKGRYYIQTLLIIFSIYIFILIAFSSLFLLEINQQRNYNYINETLLVESYSEKIDILLESLFFHIEYASINPVFINSAYSQSDNTDIQRKIILRDVNYITQSLRSIDSAYFFSITNHNFYTSNSDDTIDEDVFFDISWLSKYDTKSSGIQIIDKPRNVYTSSGEIHRYISIACPVPCLSALNKGILIYNLSIEDFFEKAFPQPDSNDVYFFVFNNNNSLIFGNPNHLFLNKYDLEKINPSSQSNRSGYEPISVNNKHIIATYTHNSIGWKIIMTKPHVRSFHYLLSFKSRSTFLMISLCLILFFLFTFSIQKLYEPIRGLLRMTDPPSLVQYKNFDEFTHINQMFDDIKRKNQNLIDVFNTYSNNISGTAAMQIINSTTIDVDSINHFNKLFKLFPDFPPLENSVVGVVKLDLIYEFKINFHKDSYYQLQKEIKNKCKNISDKTFDTFWIWSDPTTLVGILHINTSLERNLIDISLADIGMQIQNMCSDISDESIYIAFGSIANSISMLNNSYKDAIELLNNKIHNHVTYPYCFSEYKKSEVMLDTNKVMLFSYHIKFGNMSEACTMLETYFSIIHSDKSTDLVSLRKIAQELIVVIIDSVDEEKLMTNDKLYNKDILVDNLNKLSTVHDVAEYVLDLTRDACKYSSYNNFTKEEIRMRRLSEWIDKNHTQDISLESISQFIGCSATYTSKLFKSHIGIGFVSYLNNIRVEHSKQLLLTTKKTLPEIGLHVGFNNQHNFIRCFKKHVGMTPTVFRNINKEQH